MPENDDKQSDIESAFITGTSKKPEPKRAADKRPHGAKRQPKAGGSPQMAFITGATTPRTARPRKKEPTPAASVAAPKPTRPLHCSRCGQQIEANVTVPLCPMCDGTKNLRPGN